MQLIGKLDKNKIGAYADKIITDNVIITAERLRHIKEHHSDLKNKEIQAIYKIIEKPDYVLKDRKNFDTLLMIKKISYNNKNYIMVIKLNTNLKIKDKFNSVISCWHISEKKLRQYLRNETIIYKNIDK